MERITCKEFVNSYQLDETWRKNGQRAIKVSAQQIIDSPLCTIEDGIIQTEIGDVIITDEENLNIPYPTICE